MDFNKLDLSQYIIRFNQDKFNKLSILKDNNIKYVVSFHFIGMINLDENIFIWSNIIPGVNKNFIKKNKIIKQLKHKFEDFSIKNNELIYQFLTEDLIYLTDITPEFIKKMFSDLFDKSILLIKNMDNKFQVISIENILESY